ncbi:MAG: hypothetical protein JJ909_05755, partial [Roseivirga sp.]|nr:hypothetical protein [Roseivirga sp.]
MNKSKLYFYLPLIALGIFISNKLPAQNTSEQADLLHKQADGLSKTDPDSAFFLLQKAENESPKNIRKNVMAVNNWLRAKTMYLQKDYDSTIYYGHQAINLGKETRDYITLSAIHNLLGVLAKRQGQFTKSLSQYDQSMVYAQLAKDSVTWAKALQNMGN